MPVLVTACVGGGSNAMGLFSAFLNDPCEIWGVAPMGHGSILLNLSGRGDKDLDFVTENYGFGE